MEAIKTLRLLGCEETARRLLTRLEGGNIESGHGRHFSRRVVHGEYRPTIPNVEFRIENAKYPEPRRGAFRSALCVPRSEFER